MLQLFRLFDFKDARRRVGDSIPNQIYSEELLVLKVIKIQILLVLLVAPPEKPVLLIPRPSN